MKTIVNVVQNLLKPYVDNKDTAAKQAVESNIAPVEADATSASGSYSEGEQLVLNDILYDVTASITDGDPLTVGVNISAAPKLSTAVRDKQEQIDELNDGLENEAATRSALGAKNRMPLTLDSLKQTATAGTWNNNVYSENGIDYSVNTNSIGYVTSIVVSGTASNLSSMNLLGDDSTYVSNDYAGMILTGCPSGGGNDNYRTVVFIGDSQDGTGHTSQYEDGNGLTIGSNSYVRIYIRIASGTDLTTPITFYPMIRVATDTDDTYQPYSKTNKELTSEISNLTSTITLMSDAGLTYHNIPRNVPKDITSYVSDGTLWDRLNGTNGYELYEDIYVGDYWQMSRAISAYEQTQAYQDTGSQYVTIAGIDWYMQNGDNSVITAHHLVMVPGQGFGGTQHFGRSRMNSSNSTSGGYVGSEMFTTTLGAVASSGSTASTATINQQLYAEFGSHLQTTRELLSNAMDSARYNRFGQASGATSGWAWTSCQAVLMSEIEVYGSIVFSSAGQDTGNACRQLPLFAHSKLAQNNRNAWYWLKDVASAAYFCYCHNVGSATYGSASLAHYYVRPRFILA